MNQNNWAPTPQSRTSAPNYVIDQIRYALQSGALKPGDRLPSETELAASFGISRGSVRQGMKSLETLGVVTIRPGDATYINTAISQKNYNPLLFALLIADPASRELADARFALERDIIELIMNDQTAIHACLAELRENVEHHKQLLADGASMDALVDNDLAFHRILSAHCGNKLMQMIYDYIMDYFKHSLVLTTARQTAPPERNTTVGAHESIIKALENRDYDAAKKVAKNTIQIWSDLIKLVEKK